MAVIHDYFEPVPFEKGTHTCNICHKPIKGINPTNLKQHLKIKHADTYQEFLEKTFTNPSRVIILEINCNRFSINRLINRFAFVQLLTLSAFHSQRQPFKIEDEDPLLSTVISDYYDQVEDGNFQCSLCQALTSPTHLFQHFKTHRDVYSQYLERRRSIRPSARPQKRRFKVSI